MSTARKHLVILLLSLSSQACVGEKVSISESSFEGWTHAIVLANEAMDVVVVPAVGRIMAIQLTGQENVLRVDGPLAGTQADLTSGDWNNFGGDWLWPAAQSHWTTFQGRDWPPSPLLDGRPWKATAWRDLDGHHCRMSQHYGNPLNVTVTRHVTLDADDASVSVRQRIDASGDTPVPVSLWSISQIGGADVAIFPVDASRTLPNGFRTMGFDEPATHALMHFDASVVFLPERGTMNKFCTDSERAWVAARKGDTLIVERVTGGPAEGPYPDGGCSIEVFSSKDLGYTEIETLSREATLSKGQHIENVLHIECYPGVSGLTPAELVETVQRYLGETTQGDVIR